MLQRPTQWARKEITVPNLWFFSLFSHTRRKGEEKEKEKLNGTARGSHAVRSTWMAGFFFLQNFVKGGRERKAGNLRNLHAISTQKNKRTRLSGILLLFFSVYVQLTRRVRQIRESEREEERKKERKKKKRVQPDIMLLERTQEK